MEGRSSCSTLSSYNSIAVKFKEYNKLDDNAVVRLAQKGDNGAESYLINKYNYLVHFKAKSYFLQGADREDTLQEGMIGLYKAIRDYKEDEYSSFRSFALLCITRQIITALKTATRKKHLPLNYYASLNASWSEDENSGTLLDVVPTCQIEDPLELFVAEEELDGIKKTIKETLSDLEWEVLVAYIDGKSYEEIGKDLNKQTKVVDNALCRIKTKLRELK